jgi:hypothetical protein
LSNAQHDPALPSTTPAVRVRAAHRRLDWRRSSYSGGANNCVEAAPDAAFVRIRDSKSVRGPLLTVAPVAWREFLGRMSTERLGG